MLRSIIRAIIALLSGKPFEKIETALDRKAAAANQRLDWRNSIVDLLKLIGKDSSLEARQKLAKELGYTGDLNGSAEMNIWLHSKVMEQLKREGLD